MAKEQFVHLPVVFMKKKVAQLEQSEAVRRELQGRHAEPLMKPNPEQRAHSEMILVAAQEKQSPLLMENR
jgi:hypothetical protein